jgi:hypothetical protein
MILRGLAAGPVISAAEIRYASGGGKPVGCNQAVMTDSGGTCSACVQSISIVCNRACANNVKNVNFHHEIDQLRRQWKDVSLFSPGYSRYISRV